MFALEFLFALVSILPALLMNPGFLALCGVFGVFVLCIVWVFCIRRHNAGNELPAVTARLVRAYEQLEDGNRVTTVEEFHAYGRRWNVDTESMMETARADTARYFAEQTARMNARRAAGYRF